jgi:hypothetical protein
MRHTFPLGFTQPKPRYFWEKEFVFCPKEHFGATLITFVGTNLQIIKKKEPSVHKRESLHERERERGDDCLI